MKNLNAFLVFFVTLLLAFSFIPVNVAGVTECSNGKQVGENWPACDGTNSRLKTCNADGTYSLGQVLEYNSQACGYQPPKLTECKNGHPVGDLWGECRGFTEVEVRCNEDGSYTDVRTVRENSPSCNYVAPKITQCSKDHPVGDLWGECGGQGIVINQPKTSEFEIRCNEDGKYSVVRKVRDNSPSCGYVPAGTATCGNGKNVGEKWGECGGVPDTQGASYPKTTELEIECLGGNNYRIARVIRENSPSCGWKPEGPTCTPSTEVCDGKDNDCDNSVDEGDVCKKVTSKPKSQPVVVQVQQAPNNAPVLSFIGDKLVKVGKLLQFMISGTDPDNDPLTFSASNLPQGATFNPVTRIFNWIPESIDMFKNVQFSVTDSKATDTESININVVSGAPGDLRLASIDFLQGECVNPGDEFSMAVSLDNEVGQSLDDLSVTAFVPELNIREKAGPEKLGKGGEATRQLTFEVPKDAAPGEYDIRLVVTEDDGNIRRVKYRSFLVQEACLS